MQFVGTRVPYYWHTPNSTQQAHLCYTTIIPVIVDKHTPVLFLAHTSVHVTNPHAHIRSLPSLRTLSKVWPMNQCFRAYFQSTGDWILCSSDFPLMASHRQIISNPKQWTPILIIIVHANYLSTILSLNSEVVSQFILICEII